MKTLKSGLTELTVFISGAILVLIGLSITLSPAGFYAGSSIELDNSVNLISELRAPAGMLIVAGAIILASLLVKSLRLHALLISSLVYLPYGLARLIGFAVEGIPHSSIVIAAAIELTFGTIGLILLLKTQKSSDGVVSETGPPAYQTRQ